MKIGFNLTIIVMTAMVCISVIMLVALSKGLDGVLTTGTLALLAGIPTWFITKKVKEKQENDKRK